MGKGPSRKVALDEPNAEKRIMDLLLTISDPNDPFGVPAYEALLQEDQLLVSQLLIEWLWDQGRTHNQWSKSWAYDVEGFCCWLGREGSESLAHICAPTLISILNLRYDDDRTPDPSMVLWVFERLGARNYPDLIPALIDLIRRNIRYEYTKEAREILRTFDAETLTPYRRLIDELPVPNQ